MKHTLTLHSVDLKVDIDEKKEFLDQVFGRGKKGPENEYSISSFDILGRALTTLGDTLKQEDYGKVYDFLQAVEGAVAEGFSKVAGDLLTTSRNTMSEVDYVKLFKDGDANSAKDLDCNVPAMYNIIIALLEGMKICCHERLWKVKYSPRHKIESPDIQAFETHAAEELAKKKGKTKAKKEKPVLTKEFANKKVLKLDGFEKQPKKTTKKTGSTKKTK